jgi:hypothetical protein
MGRREADVGVAQLAARPRVQRPSRQTTAFNGRARRRRPARRAACPRAAGSCTGARPRRSRRRCDDGDPDRWAQLLECCADPLPNRLLVRCAEVLDPETGADEEGRQYRLKALARRFLEADRSDLAAQLASRSPGFASLLPPLLAETGDLHSQEAMLEELKRLLDAGKLPEDDRMAWMEALVSSSLPPGLFEILRRSYGPSERSASRFRITASYGAPRRRKPHARGD